MVILIGCSNVKRDGYLPAYIKYDGPLWKSLRTVPNVERLIEEDKIYVISALHGIIPASSFIDDYNVSLTDSASIDRLAELIKSQNFKATPLVVAGVKYREALIRAGINDFVTVTGGIGTKRAKLKQLLNKELNND